MGDARASARGVGGGADGRTASSMDAAAAACNAGVSKGMGRLALNAHLEHGDAIARLL